MASTEESSPGLDLRTSSDAQSTVACPPNELCMSAMNEANSINVSVAIRLPVSCRKRARSMHGSEQAYLPLSTYFAESKLCQGHASYRLHFRIKLFESSFHGRSMHDMDRADHQSGAQLQALSNIPRFLEEQNVSVMHKANRMRRHSLRVLDRQYEDS